MNKHLAELCVFLQSYAQSTSTCAKDELELAASKKLSLTRKRSVFHREDVAVRFSSAQKEKSFSNSVIGLSTLRKYDHAPFVVCVVRPSGVELLLANSTFIKKISHSSHKLRIDKIRGTFNGTDILRSYEGIENKPENFERLFELHSMFTWEQNVARIVENTSAITPTGQRFEPSEAQRTNILQSPEIAGLLSGSPEYLQLGNDLSQIVSERLERILDAAAIKNSKFRGDTLEHVITSGAAFHTLDDFSRTLSNGTEVKVDIKTKILTLTSNPKGFNIDKVLRELATGNSVVSFFFVGINVRERFAVTCLVSILDSFIINATNVRYHWAGRKSRGVSQLSGNLKRVFEPNFSETIDIEQAKQFLQELIDLKAVDA